MGKPAYEERFVFDEAVFRDYYLLHLRPHERSMGSKFIAAGGCGVALAAFILFAFSLAAADAASFNPMNPATYGMPMRGVDAPMLALVAFCLLTGIPMICLGAWYLRGRRPDWGQGAWRRRVGLSFQAIEEGGGDRPYCRRIEMGVSMLSLLTTSQSLGDTWDDKDIYLRSIASLPEPAAGCREPYGAAASVCLHGDRVEASLAGHAREVPYAEVGDILEHRRFPDVAILRGKRCGEVALLKHGFGAPWPEVRSFISARIGKR